MKQQLILVLTILFTLSITASLAMAAIPGGPNVFYGTITINNTNAPVGTVINASINGILVATITVTVAGQYGAAGTFEPKLSVSGSNGDTITFSATTPAYAGISIITEAYEADKLEEKTLAFSASATTPPSDAGGDTSGGGGGAVTTTTTPTTTTTLPPAVDIISVAPTLGLEAADVESITRVGETITQEIIVTADNIREIITAVTAEEAISRLNDIAASLETGVVKEIRVTKSLDVYDVKLKGVADSQIKSRTTLTIRVTRDMEDVVIIEVIPKTVASHIDEVTFTNLQPSRILQADPVVEFTIPSIRAGETKLIYYVVNKKLTSITAETVAVGKEVAPTTTTTLPEEIVKKRKTLLPIIIIIAALAIVLVAYLLWQKKKQAK